MKEKIELVTKEEKVFRIKIALIGVLVILFSLIFLFLSSKSSENILKDLLLEIEIAEKEIPEPWIKEAKEMTISLLQKYENPSHQETISSDIKTFTGIVFSAIENYRRLKKILQEYEMFIERIKKDLKAEEKTSAF